MAKSYIGQKPQNVSLVSALTEHAAGQTVNGVTFGKVVSYCISDFNRDGYSDVKITYDNKVEVILVNTKNALWGAEQAAGKLNAAEAKGATDVGSAFIVKKYNTLDDEIEDYINNRADGTTLNFDSGAEAKTTTKSYELVVGRDAKSKIYALLQAQPDVVTPEGQTHTVADGKVTGEQLIDIRNALSDKSFADVAYTTTTAQAETAQVTHQDQRSADIAAAKTKFGNPFGQGKAETQRQAVPEQYQVYQAPAEYQQRDVVVATPVPAPAQQQHAAITIKPSAVHAAQVEMHDVQTFRAFTFGKAKTDFYGGAEVGRVILPKVGEGTMIVVPVRNIDARIADLKGLLSSTSSIVTTADKQEARVTLERLQTIKLMLSNPNNFYAVLVESGTDFTSGKAVKKKPEIVSVAFFQAD